MAKRKNRRKFSVFMIFTFALMSMINLVPVKSSNGNPSIFIDPPEIMDLEPGTNFTVAVKVTNVTDLYGIEVQLKWDPSIIGYVSHTIKVPVENFHEGILHEPVMQLANVINENDSIVGAEPGTMAWVAYSSMYPAPSFNGSGVFFEITFNVRDIGNCWIEIVSSLLSDSTGNPIIHDTQSAYFSNVPPPPPVNIYINPPSIVDPTLTPCHNITIDVMVQGAVRLYSFELSIDYDTEILDVNQITVNQEFPSENVHVEILEEQGRVIVNASLTSPPGLSGDFSLATIEFHVTGEGESVLDLHDINLIDEYGFFIEYFEPGDGYFNNMLITKMFVSPPELIAPYLKPGDRFTIDIKIENAINMYDFEFKLSYDADILNCIGVMVQPLNNETHYVLNFSVNNAEGVIWVSVQYYYPAEPINIYGAETISTLIFQVQEYGQTLLDLYDTKVSDPEGGSMFHEVEDGFFATLLRDVAIINVNVTSSNMVYPGRLVTIEVTVMNRGNQTAETFNVTVYYDDNPIETQTVTLSPWSTVTLIFVWNTSGLEPCNNFTIWAETSTVPYEINVENNVYWDGWVKIKMLGDINGDGKIDLFDAVELISCYGSKLGDPNYNPDADIAPEYGKIDIYDAVTLLYGYGQTCP